MAVARHAERTVASRRLARWGVAAAIAAGVGSSAACGLDLQGLGQPSDAAPGDGEAGTADAFDGALDATLDATPDDGAPAESGADGQGHPPPESGVQDAAHDGAFDASDACIPTGPEDCTNGVDDDCNGLTDCEDPACQAQGFACAPNAPPGWTLVAYFDVSRPSCPAGWGSSAPTVEGPDGGTACSCACGSLTESPCVNGTLSMSLGQNVCGCAQVQNVPLVSDGLCDPINHAIGKPCGDWGDGKVAPLPPSPVACSETRTLPPIAYEAQGETCLPAGPAGGGCVDAGSCLPGAAPATACIEQAGVQPSCPAGFTTRAILFAPGDVTDARECDPCGCASAATSCTAAVLTLYDDPSCSAPGVAIPADGGCNVITGDPSDAGWFTYFATPNTTACAGPATAPYDGGLVTANPKTICCP